MADGDISSTGEAQSLAGIKPGELTARRAVDEVLGPDGPGPFPPSSGLTRGGRAAMPVVHTEDPK